MASIFLAALFALTPAAPAAPTLDAALDRRCYGLMLQLADDDDLRIRATGVTGAQYFLGRIDARQPDFDAVAAFEAGSESPAEREALVRRCGALMGAGGRDFRAIGEQLARGTGRAV